MKLVVRVKLLPQADQAAALHATEVCLRSSYSRGTPRSNATPETQQAASLTVRTKAKRAGVPLVHVDPAYTSQECSQCHHLDRKNRVDQARFACRSCGTMLHADTNASHNIARKGEAVWTAGRESRVPAPVIGAQTEEATRQPAAPYLQARPFRTGSS